MTDTDLMLELNPRTEARIFAVKVSDLVRCPRRSMLVAHYRPDGSCLCTEKPEGTMNATEGQTSAPSGTETGEGADE